MNSDHGYRDDEFRQAIIEDWKAHTKNTDEVRRRLIERLKMPMSDIALMQTAALGCHLFGKHLGNWGAGLTFLDELEDGHLQASAEAKQRLHRQRAILNRALDPSFALETFDADDRFYVMALVVPAASLQRSYAAGLSAYEQAEQLLTQIDSEQAQKLFAVMTANLVCDLLERYDLSGDGATLLSKVAEKSSALWIQIGTDEDRQKASFRLLQAFLACRKPAGYGSGRYTRYQWIES